MFNALIKTHHITSRKKIAKLKRAFSNLGVRYVLIRSGGSPGLMYVEGEENAVRHWVDAVKALKYKDYQLLSRPSHLNSRSASPEHGGFEEQASVKSFAQRLDQRGLLAWWQKAMGFLT